MGDVPEPLDDARHIIIGEDASQTHYRREKVEELLAAGSFFWLDLHRARAPTTLRCCETSSSSTRSRSRTPSTSISGPSSTTTTTTSSSSSTARLPTRTVWSRCTASTRANFLVTVHRDDCPAFREIRERYAKRAKPIERPALLLYRIVDGLVDSFFPIFADFDDRIDTLEKRSSSARLTNSFRKSSR